MQESVSPSKWAPDEIRRFYRAYHKYGSDFYKVSKMVGGGKAPELCAALWRRHQAYLSLDKNYQSEVAFVAMVQDGGASHLTTEEDILGSDRDGEGYGLGERTSGAPRLGTENELSDDDIGASLPHGGGLSRRDEEQDEEEDEEEDASLAAAAVIAMTSPEKTSQVPVEGTLAATRARRTPKRKRNLSPGRRGAPSSAGKRNRGPGSRPDDDIYEYYDEGLTDSARKRHVARRLLPWNMTNAAEFSNMKQENNGNHKPLLPGGARRYRGLDESKGVDALLALAVAGGGEDDGDAVGEGNYLEEEEEEEEDALGVLLDDERDEDYRAGGREGRGRRTPHATPPKIRSRPGSSHATPHRLSRGLASPGGLRDSDWRDYGDMLGFGGEYSGDMSYLASPGGGVSGFPGGMVPSPQNPMPRLRRRKQPPERTPLIISPLKSLFSRRQSLGGNALLAMNGLAFPGKNSEDDVPQNASEAERRVRHALGARVRKFCMFEFFYSALDRPWFMDNTMADLVAHVGLAYGTRLTRKEWSALRSGLGRPRRLSWAFLRESRARLEVHRRSTRDFYAQESLDPALAASLPRQLAVGQRVIARHPLTRQLHDGSLLTTAHDSYRVQFTRRDLGVEVVKDTDVMPSEPWENLPMTMLAIRPRLVVGGRLIINGRAVPMAVLPVSRPPMDPLAMSRGSMFPAAVVRPPIALPDPAVMAEVATHLDRKEALLVQLRQMNEEASNGMHNDAATGQPNTTFSQAYTSVALKLMEVNEMLKAKLAELNRVGNSAGSGVNVDELVSHPEGGKLPAELIQGPITATSLSAAARKEAEHVTSACRERVAAARATQQAQQAQVGVHVFNPILFGEGGKLDVATMPAAAVASLIDGAAWTLTLLQLGADRLVPANALTAALDGSILHVKPKSVVNAALYTEIEAVINALKHQLLAS